MQEHPMRSKRTRSGFTLIELLIVVSVLAIIASMAVPNFMSSRERANEAAAISTLKNIHTSQAIFRSRMVADLNLDSQGEFGYLGELSGIKTVRKTNYSLKPALLTPSFGSIDSFGDATRSGYYFRLHLPSASGVGIPEVDTLKDQVDPKLAEHFFAVVAWPMIYGRSGQRTFFLNQRGEVMGTVDSRYSGKAGAPIANAAMQQGVTAGHIATNSMARVGSVAVDGNRWNLVN